MLTLLWPVSVGVCVNRDFRLAGQLVPQRACHGAGELERHGGRTPDHHESSQTLIFWRRLPASGTDTPSKDHEVGLEYWRPRNAATTCAAMELNGRADPPAGAGNMRVVMHS